MLSEIKIKRAKSIKHNEFNDEFIRRFSTEWNIVRRLVSMGFKRYEKLYFENKDFREYVERYRKNKDISLKQVLSMKQIQLVGDMYEKEKHEKEN